MFFLGRPVLFLLIALLVSFAPLSASSATEVLDKSKAWFKSGSSWSLNFHVKVFPAGSPDVSEQRGSLLVGEKNRFRLVVPGIVFFSDGVSLWQWNQDQKQVLIKAIEDLSSTLHPSGLLFKYLNCRATAVREEVWKNKPVYVLTLDPSKYDDQFKDMEVWLSAKDYSPVRLFTTDDLGNASQYEISDLKIVKKTTIADFTFKGSKEIDEIDMR
ncbi:MAG TPA: outer membrane lipoprotein carrier protein LolA [Fibrobacter sp.]|nr:outer membrane lipoprotein carrier protein LolA [Fibrobacter sp.]